MPPVDHTLKCCAQCRGDDPMREIDLIVLEDVMKRYPVTVTPTARLFQAGSLMLVLLALAAMLAHEVAYRGPAATESASAPAIDQPALMP
jgi:hypothetical protein